MSSPDDTWWNPRTQRWEPGPEPERPGAPDPAAAPEHPGRPEYSRPPVPPAPPTAPPDPARPEPAAGPERPAGPEHSRPPVPPAPPTAPPGAARPEPHAPAQPPERPQRAGGEEAGGPARPGWPADYGRPAQPGAPAGSEDVTQVAGPGPGPAPEWYEQPAQQGWNTRPASGAGLPPLPPQPAPGYQTAWPPLPPVPEPPHQEAGQAGKWRAPLLVGVVAAVVGGASVAAWMLLGGKDDPAADARPPAPSASASATPAPGTPSTGAPSTAGPTPSGSPSPSAPPGFTVVRSGDGFSVAVPAGWGPSHDEQGNGAFYRPPGGDRSALLQIFRISEPASTGSCDLLRMSSQRLGDNTPAYRQVSVEPVAVSDCELVYEYDSAESHGRRRGMERIVTTPDGNRWALLAAGPAGDATRTRANLTAAADSFRPD